MLWKDLSSCVKDETKWSFFSFSYVHACSGYMSLEYAMEGLFSIKPDVYIFGILLLEIISGRKNSTYYDDNSTEKLVGHVSKLIGHMIFST